MVLVQPSIKSISVNFNNGFILNMENLSHSHFNYSCRHASALSLILVDVVVVVLKVINSILKVSILHLHELFRADFANYLLPRRTSSITMIIFTHRIILEVIVKATLFTTIRF